MDAPERNAEIERVANAMIHDGVSPDEQDASVLQKYAEMVRGDCNLQGAAAMDLVYEALLYRKLKGSAPGNILDKGGEFGAGFS